MFPAGSVKGIAISLLIACTMPSAMAYEAQDHSAHYSAMLAKNATTCSPREEIAAAGHAILNRREPEDLSRIAKLQLGKFDTNAAYLLIFYGQPNASETTALFDRLEDSRAVAHDELRNAYALAAHTLSPDTITTSEEFRNLRWSGWFGLIQRDGGKRFMELVSRSGWDASLAGPRNESYLAAILVKILREETDAMRAAVARAAEEAGQITTALALLADQADLGAFHALMARHPDNRFTEGLSSAPESYGASLRAQREPIPLAVEVDAKRRSFRAEYFQVKRADYRLGRHGFLLPFLNQTGRLEEIAAAAQAYADGVDSGKHGNEAGLLSLYADLVHRIGQPETDENLQIGTTAHFNSKIVIETIRWLMAREAILPFVKGETAEEPARPTLLPPQGSIDWNRWLAIASMLRSRQDEQLMETQGTDRAIAVDLAFAVDRIPFAQVLANKGFNIATRNAIHRDLLLRMDSRCDEHLAPPRSGFAGLWIPVYKFRPLDQPD